MPTPRLFVLALAALLLISLPAQAQQDGIMPELSPLVKKLLADDLLSEKQRRAAKIFHGQWDGLGELKGADVLKMAVARYQPLPDKEDRTALIKAVVQDDQTSASESLRLFAQWHYQVGTPSGPAEVVNDFDLKPGSAQWRLLIARSHEDLGQYKKAIEQLKPLREQADKDDGVFKTAAELTAAAEAIVMIARLEGRPSADYRLANKLLAKARDEADPLYWPAYIAEARLLWAKGNPREALQAVSQALSLNPKSSEAWYLLGTMRCRFFDFKNASTAVDQLRSINKEHPLADALAVQIALRQKDMAAAKQTISEALKRYPTRRELVALGAAVDALSYNDAAKTKALAGFDKLAPGNPLAQFHVGRAYNDARQYALAEPHLKAAIKRMPGWAEPQLALGELYMQWGKIKEAAAQLNAAATLDPFHKEINNQLLLAKEMLGYATIKTDQFIVRFKPGIDEVLARDVKLHMGEMVEKFIATFKHDPPALTQVDIMPDDQHFAVRVTGMPEIWTIAACTGNVIAMTPPRPGPKRNYGAYNWLNVMGHEYAHVVNLSQTDNRVPHWFTEGCAVRMETTGRLWSQYTLLAESYNTGKLFKYDQINWGFIRPTADYHRPLAYAQSSWIIEYIKDNHGWDKVLAMIEHYKKGTGEHETIQKVFGFDHHELMKRFMAWAGKEVNAWGMSNYGKKPKDSALAKLLASVIKDPTKVDPTAIDKALDKHPGEPGLLKIKAEQAVATGSKQEALAALKRYKTARPVDPWADRELARLALEAGEAETAVQSLKKLDQIEGNMPQYAVELARVYRGRKQYDQALKFAERALLREPYNATYRETAAAIAIQKKDLERAAFHVESLALLEPDRWIHPRRLSVIYTRLGQQDKADKAAAKAKKLRLEDDKR